MARQSPGDTTQDQRILFVDDDPQVRSSLMRLTRRAGLVAEAAATGEEALALASHERYSVVVADIHMPGMGGVALLERIAAMLPQTRIIVLTGDRTQRRGDLTRVEQVLYKPWDEDTLLDVLTGEAQRESQRPPLSRRHFGANEPLRVLVVEDNRLDRELLRVSLRKGGQAADFHHAERLDEALALLRSESYDIVFSDLGLPDSEGLSSVFGILGAAPDTPLVVLTSSQDDLLARRAVKAGAQDFLMKGAVGATDIVRTLRHAIERKAAEQRVLKLALYDQLTGLANRSLLRQRLAHTLARSRHTGGQFALAILDMDRFKHINDALGHDAGDTFLQEVAARLLRAIRDVDMVARLGGDEFAILIDPLDKEEEVVAVAERITAALAQPYHLEGIEVRSSASLGIALYPVAGDSTDALFQAADAAVYEAKGSGRNGYHVYGEDLSQRIARQLELQGELPHALEREEFHLVFQAQVCMKSGEPFAAEALLRWTRPSGERVSPGEFIPLLEESGQVDAVGNWVLEEACRYAVGVEADGRPALRMCVNVSARQLANPSFAETVEAALERTGLAPERLELEVTESTLLENMDLTRAHVERLRGRGVRLALDDFGTGWASLSYLTQFDADMLKLDRTFVTGIEADERRTRIIRAIVELGQALGMEVLAEGIETDEQRRHLLSLGCDLAQGYFFHRPARDLVGSLSQVA